MTKRYSKNKKNKSSLQWNTYNKHVIEQIKINKPFKYPTKKLKLIHNQPIKLHLGYFTSNLDLKIYKPKSFKKHKKILNGRENGKTVLFTFSTKNKYSQFRST